MIQRLSESSLIDLYLKGNDKVHYYNQGKKWADEDKARLINYVTKGSPIEHAYRNLLRTPIAVYLQAITLCGIDMIPEGWKEEHDRWARAKAIAKKRAR